MLFSAILGTGNQLAILTLIIILYTIVGDLYAERATMLTATIFLYALTCGVAGYKSASCYARYGGRDWIRNMMLTATLWPAVVAVVTGTITTVAYSTKPFVSTRAVDYTVIVSILICFWWFYTPPLTSRDMSFFIFNQTYFWSSS